MTLPTADVPTICQSLRVLADMAYRQKRFVFYGHLTDAARLLRRTFLPEHTCAFCEEFISDCWCDERRQGEKDEEDA